jgi:hypothetical protein
MNPLNRILLVEDSPRDAELILDALDANQLANGFVHVRDGADALDAPPENPHDSERVGATATPERRDTQT